jgi:hypothetical protein
MGKVGRFARVMMLLALAGFLAGGGKPPTPAPCGIPGDQPEHVFGVYTSLFGISFPLDEATCAKLVSSATAACHRAVSDCASCIDHLIGSLFKGNKAVCAASKAPAACVDDAKQEAAEDRDAIDAMADGAHQICDGEFAAALAADCAGLKKF